jgi:hypothetical protein
MSNIEHWNPSEWVLVCGDQVSQLPFLQYRGMTQSTLAAQVPITSLMSVFLDPLLFPS